MERETAFQDFPKSSGNISAVEPGMRYHCLQFSKDEAEVYGKPAHSREHNR